MGLSTTAVGLPIRLIPRTSLRWFCVGSLLCLSLFCSVVAAEDAPSWHADATKAARRAAAWLSSKQAPDGGWHSETYGNLKEGAATSSLAIYSLGHLPPSLREPHQPQVEKALAYLDKGRLKSGAIAGRDGSLDYPTYATALWLTGRRLWDKPAAASDQASVEYLLSAQLTASRGFTANHAAFGGWDLLGPGEAIGITTGSNVAVTVFVLESLEPVQTPAAMQAKKDALGWLLRAHQFAKDGGFPFGPEPGEHQHKGGMRDETPLRPFSYGSSTADGLRCLLYAGAKRDDVAVVQASAWLQSRDAVDVVPGFEQLPPEIGWQRGLRFYYYQSLAKTLPYLPADVATRRRAALVKGILAQQADNGSWVNESARMREDDPLIATSFCLIALGELLRK